MKSETPESIAQWARETFGDTPEIMVATRANQEVAELVTSVWQSKREHVIEEIADVFIMLCQIPVTLARRKVDVELGMTELEVLFDHEDAAENESCGETALRVQRLMADVIWGLHTEDYRRAILAIGRIAMDLMAMSDRLDGDLDEEVDKKMTINRARDWARGSNGHYQHVEGEKT